MNVLVISWVWIIRLLTCENVQLLVEVRLAKNFFGGPKLGPKLDFLPFSQVCIVSFPWYYTSCSLEQYLTFSRAGASKKTLVTQIRAEIMFSSIFFPTLLKKERFY